MFLSRAQYVTWEIAPGRLQDGSVVDVWGRTDVVNWKMPGSGAPCTSTSRPGRWRSFPYLADLEGEDAEALWGYLCDEWDRENEVDTTNPGRKLLRFNFFYAPGGCPTQHGIFVDAEEADPIPRVPAFGNH